MKPKRTIHYLAAPLIRPTDAITVNLIGAGGTGSRLASLLAEGVASLHALDHPGLHLRLFDDDMVSPANIGRQRFSPMETGLHKSVAVINRINRGFGFNWEAVTERYDKTWVAENENPTAQITITCTDTVASRIETAEILHQPMRHPREYAPLYWIDCGNSRHTGPVWLSTTQIISQAKSRKFTPVAYLPSIIEEFGDQLKDQPDVPSCSVREALSKQDQFVNHDVALGCASLLWQLLTNGYTHYKGVFINTATGQRTPVPIMALPPDWLAKAA